MVLLIERCRLCNAEDDLNVGIEDYAEIINRTLPITISDENTTGDKLCHTCVFDITLFIELVNKYKRFESLPTGDKCYLCLQEEVHFRITGNLFHVIKVVENSLTLKQTIFASNGVIGHESWNTVKRRLRKRRICHECYFLMDTVYNLYNKIKELDAQIRDILENTGVEAYSDTDDEEENNNVENGYSEEESDEDDEEGEEGEDGEEGSSAENSDEEAHFNGNGAVKEEVQSDEMTDDEFSEEVESHSLMSQIKQEPLDEDTDVRSKKRGRPRKIKNELGLDDTENQAVVLPAIKEEEEDDSEEDLPSRKRQKRTDRSNETIPILKNSNIKREFSSDPSEHDHRNLGRQTRKRSVILKQNKRGAAVKSDLRIKEEPEEEESDDQNSQGTDGETSSEEDTKIDQFTTKRPSRRGRVIKGKQIKIKEEPHLDSDIDDNEFLEASEAGAYCSWCKTALSSDCSDYLCGVCLGKQRKAMVGILSGVTCRVILTDLKYSKIESGFDNLSGNATGSKRKGQNRRSSVSSGSSKDIQAEPALKTSLINTPNKKNRKTSSVSKKTVRSRTNSGSFSTLKEPTNSKLEKRTRTQSITSSCSEMSSASRRIKESSVEPFSEEESTNPVKLKQTSYSSKSDPKLQLIKGWIVKLDKISLGQSPDHQISNTNITVNKEHDTSSEHSDTDDSDASGNTINKQKRPSSRTLQKSRKPGPKSKTKSVDNQERNDYSDIDNNSSYNVKKNKPGPKSKTKAVNNAESNDDSDVGDNSESNVVSKQTRPSFRKPGPKSKTNVVDNAESNDDSDVGDNSDSNVVSKQTRPSFRKPGPKSKTNVVDNAESNDDSDVGDNSDSNVVSKQTRPSSRKPGPKSKAKVVDNTENNDDSDVGDNSDSNVVSKQTGPSSRKPGPKSKVKVVDNTESNDDSDVGDNSDNNVVSKQTHPSSRKPGPKSKAKVVYNSESNDDSDVGDNSDSNVVSKQTGPSSRKPGPKSKAKVVDNTENNDDSDVGDNSDSNVVSKQTGPSSRKPGPKSKAKVVDNTESNDDSDVSDNSDSNVSKQTRPSSRKPGPKSKTEVADETENNDDSDVGDNSNMNVVNKQSRPNSRKPGPKSKTEVVDDAKSNDDSDVCDNFNSNVDNQALPGSIILQKSRKPGPKSKTNEGYQDCNDDSDVDSNTNNVIMKKPLNPSSTYTDQNESDVGSDIGDNDSSDKINVHAVGPESENNDNSNTNSKISDDDTSITTQPQISESESCSTVKIPGSNSKSKTVTENDVIKKQSCDVAEEKVEDMEITDDTLSENNQYTDPDLVITKEEEDMLLSDNDHTEEDKEKENTFEPQDKVEKSHLADDVENLEEYKLQYENYDSNEVGGSDGNKLNTNQDETVKNVETEGNESETEETELVLHKSFSDNEKSSKEEEEGDCENHKRDGESEPDCGIELTESEVDVNKELQETSENNTTNSETNMECEPAEK